MKFKHKISSILAAMSIIVGLSGCSKKLVEQPYTVFTVDYFKTPSGAQNAVNAIYSGFRYFYGPNGGLTIMNAGTDEWTYGDQANGQELEMGTYTISTTNGSLLTPWNRSFSNINMANAVLQYTPGIAMDTASKTTLIAEAHFLRGLYYFILVQQFGAVPLDLGSGELAFNQNPFQGFNRMPTADLFTKDYAAIIADFTYATQNLPNQRPAGAFKLSKGVAYLMLSKAYTYRAYSAAKQATDFASAYTAATTLINNQATYGTALQTDYATVHAESNDYNSEILYSVERIPGDPTDNEVASPGSDFTNKANISNNWFNCNYQNNVAIPANSGLFPVDRVQQYNRPLRQLCPTPYVYNVAFADKYTDSRYDNSFRTVWLATNNNVPTIKVGDTAYFLAPSNAAADSMALLGKKYRVVAPREFYLPSNPAIQLYPSLKKYDDNKRGAVNDVSGRPFVVSKLSEAYLLAAEAAIQDNHPADALPLIMTLRKRAAYRAGLSATDLTARQNAMTMKNTGTAAAPVYISYTTADMTLDFVLDERTRELCGESVRWADLACRNRLVDRVKLYNAAASKVQTFNQVRPIPQSQLDAISDLNKTQYQNPGY